MGAVSTLEVITNGIVPASGNITLKLAVERPKQVWKVGNAAVSVSTATLEPTCICYKNPATRIGGTETGSNDNIPMAVTVRPGGFIYAVFTGADVGALAELALYGSIYLLGT